MGASRRKRVKHLFDLYQRVNVDGDLQYPGLFLLYESREYCGWNTMALKFQVFYLFIFSTEPLKLLLLFVVIFIFLFVLDHIQSLPLTF